jgi:hypothetical protein
VALRSSSFQFFRFDQALGVLASALELRDDADAHFQIAEALVGARRDMAAAVRHLDKGGGGAKGGGWHTNKQKSTLCGN